MGTISQCKPMSLEGNLYANWCEWKTNFHKFLSAANLTDVPESRLNALLLHFIGKPAFKIFESFNLNYENVSHSCIIDKFESHFSPKINVTKQRSIFLSRKQHKDESLESFKSDLFKLYSFCKFSNKSKSLVKDIFINGLHEQQLRNYLLEQDLSTFDEILKAALNFQISDISSDFPVINKSASTSMLVSDINATQSLPESKVNSLSSKNEIPETILKLREKEIFQNTIHTKSVQELSNTKNMREKISSLHSSPHECFTHSNSQGLSPPMCQENSSLKINSIYLSSQDDSENGSLSFHSELLYSKANSLLNHDDERNSCLPYGHDVQSLPTIPRDKPLKSKLSCKNHSLQINKKSLKISPSSEKSPKNKKLSSSLNDLQSSISLLSLDNNGSLKISPTDSSQSLFNSSQSETILDHLFNESKSQFSPKLSCKNDHPPSHRPHHETDLNWRSSTDDSKTKGCHKRGHQVHNFHCPAKNVRCYKCKKLNHFAKFCQTKSTNNRSPTMYGNSFQKFTPNCKSNFNNFDKQSIIQQQLLSIKRQIGEAVIQFLSKILLS